MADLRDFAAKCVNPFPERQSDYHYPAQRLASEESGASPGDGMRAHAAGDALIKSVSLPNTKALQHLLDMGASPYSFAVEVAAMKNNQIALSLFFKHGWPVNKPLQDGAAPPVLHCAVSSEGLLSWLLKEGADPNVASNTDDTALSTAVQSGTPRAVRMLLYAGGNVRRGNLLHRALDRDSSWDVVEIIHLLISKGARIDEIEHASRPVLQKSCRLPEDRGTALHRACYLGKTLAVDTLLRHGANVYANQVRDDQRGTRYRTPIQVDKEEGYDEIIVLLEEAASGGGGLTRAHPIAFS
ncbi:hypothetical protein CERZMDRAFT_84832 [Cercospora zeae-maydis SCOH1-5]|uniref:Uncharacterized protein n=1 Tax=Cercospora zeae-maydis SCOH1-5 TaxID=717836 RepID=A0A6A6FGK8_9PEZI|nr:hypothetical protein CERZMDRAFT_84832 [Cercospora zeae-maydis SCOH1-5]